MQWSTLGQSRAAVVGYNAEGNFFENHPSSGFATVGQTISCGFNQERRKRQDEDPLSRIPMQLPTDDDLKIKAEACVARFRMEVNLFKINPTRLATALADYPCPSKLDQAITDAARFVLHTTAPLCYVSSVSRVGNDISESRSITVSATQQCCYDNNG